MKTCPECKGKKKFKIPNTNSAHVYSDEPIIYEIYVCGTCQGTGEISELQMAIYKARGGPMPPPVMKCFA